ncbi:endolytic transglycosylase MltG [Candidatus Parcubacteria bacterium]|nr:endolytic transglycosylase MltG [Candidatus Parcubacteria bacterium]
MQNPIFNGASLALDHIHASWQKFRRDPRLYISILIIVIAVVYTFTATAPRNFPKNSIVTLREGAGLLELSNTLKESHAIRSAVWFRSVVIALGGEKSIKAGDYYLGGPESVWHLAWRMVNGKHDIETIKITIPEGLTVKEISNLFDKKFVFFDHSYFERHSPEGYLFPDTYFVGVNTTASSTSKFFQETFDKKIKPLESKILASGHTKSDLVTMASILEAEAKTETDMKIVSGILWKRINLGMPLQVDATLGYIVYKASSELTQSDLELDTPYNTYKYRGLPPTPIGNPGLVALDAAINPTSTSYLYFLSDKKGNMHYAKTHEEHVANIQKYL